MSRSKSFAVYLVVLLILFTGLYYTASNTSLLNDIGSSTRYNIPSEISTSFSRNFSFNSISPSNEEFYFYLTPPENGFFQNVSLLIDHSPTTTETTVHSYNRTYLRFGVFPGNSYIDVHYNITSKGESWQGLDNQSGNVSEIPLSLKKQYDHPEYFNNSKKSYEVINPSLFRSLTLSLTTNQSTVAGKLRAIYDYIIKNFKYNITYNIGNVPLTAQQVYNKKIGDCEELSYLFESMSRSIGIPSWMQYGMLIQKVNGKYVLAEHAWVQTYIPLSNNTGTNVNIDLTVEVGGKNLGRGFLVKFPNSIIEWTDNGNSSDMVMFHTELTYPSVGLSIQMSETDNVHSFSQSGMIYISQILSTDVISRFSCIR